jgi:hypothetical protein
MLLESEDDIDEELLEDELLEELEVAEEVYVSAFVEDIQVLAKEYINRFFKTQEMYCGGPVPERFLLTEENISLVINTSLEHGVRRAYQIIENDGHYSGEAVESLVPDDVKLVIKVMNACARLSIPPEFIPGIVLLYLQYCEGMKV